MAKMMKPILTNIKRIWRFYFWFVEALFVGAIVLGVAMTWAWGDSFFEDHSWLAIMLGGSAFVGFWLLLSASLLSLLTGPREYSLIGALTLVTAIVLAVLFPSTGSHRSTTSSSQSSTPPSQHR